MTSSQAVEFSAEKLGVLLREEKTLRLAVLNACQGGAASTDDIFSGTAQSLIHQEIPAVVAMQFEISDDSAITFSHEFYQALAHGDPIDAAVTWARRAMFTQGDEVEWGTPVLYMRAPDGRLFDVQAPGGAPHAAVRSAGSAAAASLSRKPGGRIRCPAMRTST
jgi:CHAT domain-containing protein